MIRFLALLLFVLPAVAEIIPTERRITWEGNYGLESGIPTGLTVFTNMTGIPNDASADAAAGIQSAINACPDNQVVYLPAGTYALSNTLTFSYATPVILRGAGMSNTIFIGRMAITGPTTWNSYHSVTSGGTMGSTNIIIDVSNDEPSAIKPGWFLMMESAGDTNFVNADGYEGYWSDRTAGQQLELLTVTGKTNLTFQPPLYWTNGLLARVKLNYANTTSQNYVTNVGLENFTLIHDGGTDYAIDFLRTARCWVSGVEVTNSKVGAIRFHSSYRPVVRSNYVHNSSMFGSGGGYGIIFQIKTTQGLIEDNIISKHAGSILIDDGSVGNVIAYNWVPDFQYFQTNWIVSAISTHSSHPMFNLFEGNVAPNFYGDFIHGSSSHATLFRNQFFGWASTNHNKQRFAVANDSWVRWYNIVGNVLGVPTKPDVYQMVSTNFSFDSVAIYALEYDPVSTNRDTMVRELIYQHGNYDYFDNETKWASTNADHTLPDSLYLTEKPSWFGTRPFPPIDGSTGETNLIPAQARWYGIDYTSQHRVNAVNFRPNNVFIK